MPAWSKEPRTDYSTINARAETVATKPAFRNAFKFRRCIIAADGYYEWTQAGHAKLPYYIRLNSGEPFGFAGLWELWEKGGEPLETCSIIVTAANELTQPIHNRMPVILSHDHYDAWLDPHLHDADLLTSFLRPYPSVLMNAYPVDKLVDKLVNNPRNDSAELIRRLSDPWPPDAA